jgi:hypothetical protein
VPVSGVAWKDTARGARLAPVRVRLRGIVSLLATGVVGAATAVAIVYAAGPAVTAGAATTAQTVTLGSTIGSPTENICVASVDCTYAPFTGVEAPALQVPFDGTVTSFSVNSGSTGNQVELRVLRPAGGGQFTGAGTSPAETLAGGATTFTVSLPVKAGDILGLDNSDSALIFDATPSAITAYYELPSLADGVTAAPNHNQSGDRLLLSAVVVQQTTTATGTSNTTTTGTPTTAAPTITGLRQARRRWREGTQPATIARAATGTVFTFDLSAAARVTMTFTGRVAGRRVGGRCVAPTRANRHHPSCRRTLRPGRLSFAGHVGANAVSFDGLLGGHLLPVGQYTARFTATDAHGQATPTTLTFTIVG